ncbi:Embryo sac development arrest 7 [Rhynchospora pubera]|uniref:Embryo sac development arrest 7 n=1 Tax=Rhynchospora pubera TaxID=906938 RepID=A0AAV8E8X8_9POAL|nr:Embryo sac development arrest 7 [Rhynchospora pubera]
MATKVGSMKSTSINGVKLYTLSGQHSTADLLDPKKKRALRKNKDYLQRVDLIQNLRFETSTNKIKVTPDGDYFIASGIYPPQVKVFELKELSQKFERHLISEIINFEILADDYSKLAFLCSDRSVALHAKYGAHYSLRIPRMGRDIAYDCWSCDLLCAASSPDIYRINLEQGRFLQSLTSQSPGINVISRSAIHGLIACGGEDGAVECFDMRQKSSVGRISTLASTNDIDQEVTALKFDENQGYLLAVGTSTGKIPIYDLRMSDPVRVKDHFYGEAISSIKWHQTLNLTEPKLITADGHVVRIWDPNTGDDMAKVESSGGTINDVCIFKNSGLLLLALDNGQIPAHFLPALGPAPKWCSYLENLTEEMEENAETVIYENYKFLTKEDLERLNLTNLIGTNLLKAYMHGFFIDYGLYKKAKILAEPFNPEEVIARKRQQEEEAKRQGRITLIKKLPKVNRRLAAQLHEREEADNYEKENADDTGAKKKKKNRGLTTDIMQDDRFKQIFQNPDYEIDEQSQEYLQYHPQQSKRDPSSLIEEHFEPAMDDEDDDQLEAGSSDASEADELEAKRSKPVRLYEIKDERHAEAFWSNKSLAHEDALPLGDRVAALQAKEKHSSRGRGTNEVKFGPGGSREVSFYSRSSKKHRQEEEPKEDVKRRGVHSLGLKMGKQEYYSMGGNRGGRGRGGRGRGRGRGRR